MSFQSAVHKAADLISETTSNIYLHYRLILAAANVGSTTQPLRRERRLVEKTQRRRRVARKMSSVRKSDLVLRRRQWRQRGIYVPVYRHDSITVIRTYYIYEYDDACETRTRVRRNRRLAGDPREKG